MIIDGHNHLGVRPGRKQTAEELIERMNRDGIDMAIAFNFVEIINNDYIANVMKKYPNRIVGFACVNPWREDATKELIRSIEKLDLKGLKLNPTLHGYALSNHILMDPIFELCAKYKIPVTCHGGDEVSNMPLQFREIAETFPEVTIIMVHSGFMYSMNEALITAKKCKNILLDTTGVSFTLDIKNFVEDLGAERVVMGSDTPFTEFEVSITTIKRAISDSKQRELILGGNYERLLGLKK